MPNPEVTTRAGISRSACLVFAVASLLPACNVTSRSTDSPLRVEMDAQTFPFSRYLYVGYRVENRGDDTLYVVSCSGVILSWLEIREDTTWKRQNPECQSADSMPIAPRSSLRGRSIVGPPGRYRISVLPSRSFARYGPVVSDEFTVQMIHR